MSAKESIVFPFPASTWWWFTFVSFSSRKSDTLLWPPWTYQARMWYTDMHEGKTHIAIKHLNLKATTEEQLKTMVPRAFVWVEKYYHPLKTVHWKENGLHKYFRVHPFGTFSCLSNVMTRYLRRNNLERFIWFIQDLGIWPMMMRKTWHRDAAASLLAEQEANREKEWSHPN